MHSDIHTQPILGLNGNLDTMNSWPPLFIESSHSRTLSNAIYLEIYVLVGTVTYRIAPLAIKSDMIPSIAVNIHKRFDTLITTMRLLRGQMIHRVKQLMPASLDDMAIRARVFAMMLTNETLLALVPYALLVSAWGSAVQELRKPEIFFTCCPVLSYPAHVSFKDIEEFMLGKLPNLIYGNKDCSSISVGLRHGARTDFPIQLKQRMSDRLRHVIASRDVLMSWAQEIGMSGDALQSDYKLDPWTSMLLIHGYMSGVVLTSLYDRGNIFSDMLANTVPQWMESYCYFLWNLILLCESTFQARGH